MDKVIVILSALVALVLVYPVGHAGPAKQKETSVVEDMSKAGGAASVTVTGEVVPGVECPAILTDDGRRIALSYLPASFELGDRVTVRGSGYAGSASCQQEVLVVEEVSRAEGD